MTVRVLGLAGSSRRRGNTALLLARALEGAAEAGAEVERIDLCRLHIAPCVACAGCEAEGVCIVQDDFQSTLSRLLAADAVVLAAPVYFLGVPAAVKAFIDRCQCLWARKHVLKQPLPRTSDGRPRRAAFLSVAGGPRTPFSGSIATVKAWLQTLGAEYLGDVLRRGYDEAGAIRRDPAALDEAYALGRALVG